MNYLLRRLFATLPVMAVVAVVVFLLIHLSPGDPAALIAGDLATTEDIEKLRAALGLDQPLWRQFALWLGRVLSGDLGMSIFTQVPVTKLLAQPRRQLDRPAGNAVCRARVLGPGVPDRLPADLHLCHPYSPVPGAGLCASVRGRGALAQQPGTALHQPGAGLHRPDHAHDARHRDGSAAGRLHPHRPRQGAGCTGRAGRFR